MTTSQPPSSRSQTREAPRESLLSRLLITPLTFISFLLSLALVSNHNTASRSRRTYPSTQTPKGLLSHIARCIKSLFLFRADGESSNPYADIKKPVPLGVGDGRPRLERDASRHGGERGDQGWFWHSNQRKLLKMEVADALEIRKWVLIVLLGVVGVVLSVGVLGLTKLWRMLSGRG